MDPFLPQKFLQGDKVWLFDLFFKKFQPGEDSELRDDIIMRNEISHQKEKKLLLCERYTHQLLPMHSHSSFSKTL